VAYGDVPDAWYPNEKGDINGIPRVLRKAINYAFDYDHMIDVGLEGKGVRSGGVVGVDSIYFNASVPQPYFNKTYARELLLTTETDTSGEVYTTMGAGWGYWPDPDLYNFSKRTADRGLTASSTDAEWQAVAESLDPVWKVDFYWDQWHEELKDEFQAALYSIGVGMTDPNGITNRVPQRIWDVVQTYWMQTFDGTNSIWSADAWPMDYYVDTDAPEIWIDFTFKDPDDGRWRTLGAGGITSWWPTWNFGFVYDTEVDAWLDRQFMSEPALKKSLISKIADKVQNDIYAFIFTYQGIGGYAQWDCWETELFVHPRTGILVGLDGFPGGVYAYSNINYKGCPVTAPLIPGFPLVLTMTVAAVSILSVAYVLIKRKKLR
jgi:hypothetical protein